MNPMILYQMFVGCQVFSSNLPWDTSNVVDMSGMVSMDLAHASHTQANSALTSVEPSTSQFALAISFAGDISAFNTSSVTNMNRM